MFTVSKPAGDHPEDPNRAAAAPRTPNRGRDGMTLLEVIAVVAILAILAGIVAPSMTRDVDEARVERARADVVALAEALEDFFVTVGSWPTMDASGRIDRLLVLISGSRIPARSPYTRGHPFWTWASGARGDLLGNHLIQNTPRGQSANRYPTTGRSVWRGPYLDATALDPWGRPYVVNVVSGYSASATRYQRLWALSAGPDGAFQTSASARVSDDIAGDDIGFLIRQR